MLKPSKLILASTALALSLSWVGCSTGPMLGSHVAKVNEHVITQKEFDESFNRILKTMNLDPKMLNAPESEPLLQMFKKITLQNLILNSLVAEEAEKRHIEISDKELDELYEKHITRAGGEKAIEDQLKKMNLSKADFKKELKNQLLKDKLIDNLAGSKVQVNEPEVRAFFKAHPQEFDQPEQVRARHILVMADPVQIKQDVLKLKKDMPEEDIQKQVEQTMAEKRKKAEDLLSQIKNTPAKFEELATKHSDDTGSAKNGGDLGYFAKEVMVEPFAKAAFSTKPGQVHNTIVQTQFGYHIIQVLDRKAPEKKAFDDVKDQITMMLENQKKSEFMEEWMEKVKKSAHIEVSKDYEFAKELENNSKNTSKKTESANPKH